jgi:hypothetical protein
VNGKIFRSAENFTQQEKLEEGGGKNMAEVIITVQDYSGEHTNIRQEAGDDFDPADFNTNYLVYSNAGYTEAHKVVPIDAPETAKPATGTKTTAWNDAGIKLVIVAKSAAQNKVKRFAYPCPIVGGSSGINAVKGGKRWAVQANDGTDGSKGGTTLCAQIENAFDLPDGDLTFLSGYIVGRNI